MTALQAMHPEDIKAGLRKRFGSIANFERKHGLPEKSVNDVLRGRQSARVSEAVEAALTTPVPNRAQSEVSDDSEVSEKTHRLNAEAR